jgi:two-component system chemotaxis sensor kinase CheA
MNVDMSMFHQAFFEEAADLMADFERYLLTLEDQPDDTELLNSIFRCAHSIKGSSGTFGFSDVAHFTHGVETLLDRVRNGKIAINSELVQLLLESLDQMRALIDVARGEAESAPDGSALLARIEAAAAGTISEPGSQSAGSKQSASSSDMCEPKSDAAPLQTVEALIYPGPNTLRQGMDPTRLIKELLGAGEVKSIVCDDSKLPPLGQMDPECVYLGWRITLESDWSLDRIREIFDFIADESNISISIVESGPTSADRPTRLELVETASPAVATSDKSGANGAAPVAAVADTHTLRVATDKVDKLINLVGELVINQSMLNESIQDFSMDKMTRLTEAVEAMERASRELQERVMAIRMLPIKHAFGRFPRLVRDLAASHGKKIDLHMSGEETELDKGVIDAIGDPLTHLVRNSVDHGIETPQERREAGKSEIGQISLNAFHEGGSIIIEISDDGRGIDRERVLGKAIEKGLAEENDNLSDEAIFDLIFQAGFSTAAVVTDLSGRGVGMDIVKKSVQSLGGSISLSSSVGKGTRFRIRLPLTMAILEGLSLAVGDETYILPLTSIVESVRPKASDVKRIGARAEVVTMRGVVLPLKRLYEQFNIVPRVTDPSQGLLVIVENDGRKAALLVDELIGQSQVVIKSIEANYRKVKGIAGATILGNGRIALILDVPGLLHDTDAAAAPDKNLAA